MYKLEDKEYDFGRVIVKDALLLKSAIMIQANDKSSLADKEESDNIINNIALKYLKVKVNNEWIENCNEDFIALTFENEFAIIEIIAQFQKRISGLMGKLPSFQQQPKAKRK